MHKQTVAVAACYNPTFFGDIHEYSPRLAGKPTKKPLSALVSKLHSGLSLVQYMEVPKRSSL